MHLWVVLSASCQSKGALPSVIVNTEHVANVPHSLTTHLAIASARLSPPFPNMIRLLGNCKFNFKILKFHFMFMLRRQRVHPLYWVASWGSLCQHPSEWQRRGGRNRKEPDMYPTLRCLALQLALLGKWHFSWLPNTFLNRFLKRRVFVQIFKCLKTSQ